MIVADTHVHVYPSYDVARFMSDAATALSRNATGVDVDRVLMLTERFDCHFFKDLIAGKVEGLSVRPGPDGVSARVALTDGEVWVVAGRQVVSSEGIEVLALTTDAEIADRQPVSDILQQVSQAGGIAVLSWAPGKWLFKRGAMIRELVRCSDPSSLVLGDTSMRPPVWLEPLSMRAGRERGIPVIAGSDPLPFAEDQGSVGRYVTSWQVALDVDRPVAQLRDLIRSGTGAIAGRRSSTYRVIRRFLANQKVR